MLFVGKPRLVYTGPAANGAASADTNVVTYSTGQSSVIVPFVTTYSAPFVSSSSNGEQLATLQPSSIKRTYPPASSSPAPNATGGSGSQDGAGQEKKIKIDVDEESEK